MKVDVGIRTQLMAFERGGQDGIKNLALIDSAFRLTPSTMVDHNRWRAHNVERCGQHHDV